MRCARGGALGEKWQDPIEIVVAVLPGFAQEHFAVGELQSRVNRTGDDETLPGFVTGSPRLNLHMANQPLAVHALDGVSVQAEHPQYRQLVFTVVPYVE